MQSGWRFNLCWCTGVVLSDDGCFLRGSDKKWVQKDGGAHGCKPRAVGEPPAEEEQAAPEHQSEEPADYPDCDPDRAAMYEDYTRLYEQDELDDDEQYYYQEEEYGYSSEEDRYSPLDQLSRSELYLYYEAQEESDAD